MPYIAEFIWGKFKRRNPTLADIIEEVVDAVKVDVPNAVDGVVESITVNEICKSHSYYSRREVTKATKRYLAKSRSNI